VGLMVELREQAQESKDQTQSRRGVKKSSTLTLTMSKRVSEASSGIASGTIRVERVIARQARGLGSERCPHGLEMTVMARKRTRGSKHD